MHISGLDGLAHLEYKEEEDKLAKRQKKVETLHRNKGLRARGYGHRGYGNTYDRLGRIRTGRT